MDEQIIITDLRGAIDSLQNAEINRGFEARNSNLADALAFAQSATLKIQALLKRK